MPKLREDPEGLLTLLFYLCNIEDWFDEHGAPGWGHGAFVDFEGSIQAFRSKLGAGPLPNVGDRILHWYGEYRTPFNVASGQFHQGSKPNGLGLEPRPSKDELLSAMREWMVSWRALPNSQVILEAVQNHRYSQFGEEQKVRILDRVFKAQPIAIERAGARKRHVRTPFDSAVRSYSKDRPYEFLQNFVRLAESELWILTYSVEPRALEILLEGVRPLRRVVIAAQKIVDQVGQAEIKEVIRRTTAVQNPELHTVSKLHAKLILRDPGPRGAVLVGSANLTARSLGSDVRPGAFEVCAFSAAPEVVRCAIELFGAVSGRSEAATPGSGSERLLHSFSGGGIPKSILDRIESSDTSVVFSPRFMDDWIYGSIIEAAHQAEEQSGTRRKLTIKLAWPNVAGRRLRPMLLELKSLQSKGLLGLTHLDPNFHGKVYFFNGGSQPPAVIVASSNLTRGSWIKSIECGLYSEDTDFIKGLEDQLGLIPQSPSHDPGILVGNGNGNGGEPKGKQKQWIPVQPLEGQGLIARIDSLFASFRARFPNEEIPDLPEPVDEMESYDDLQPDGRIERRDEGERQEPARWTVRGAFYARRGYWQSFSMVLEAPSQAMARERALSRIGGCHGVKRGRIDIVEVTPAIEMEA
jgi:ribosomal protein L20A (L18A)